MRRKLEELEPEWIDAGGTERAGFVFSCPVHKPACRISVWLRSPGGGGQPVTETEGRLLHQHEGDLFDEMTLGQVVRHEEVWLFISHGEVVAG